MKKIFCSVLVVLMSTFCLVQNHIHAKNVNFSITSDATHLTAQSEVLITINVNSDAHTNLSTFKFTLNYDPNTFKYKGLIINNKFHNDEFKTHVNNGAVDIIYLTSDNGINISSNENLDMFCIKLQVNKNAKASASELSFTTDGVGNYDATRLSATDKGNITLNIEDKPSYDCRLSNIVPDVDAPLIPNFSPDTYEYELHVSSDIKKVEFEATPLNPDTIIRQRKKNLSKAGESTEILIDAYSPDKKVKKTYHINVYRDSKEKTPKSSKKTKKTSTRTKKGAKTSDLKNMHDIDEAMSDDDLDSSNDKLVVKENGFNIFIFLLILAACVGAWYVVMKLFLFFKKRKQDVQDSSE